MTYSVHSEKASGHERKKEMCVLTRYHTQARSRKDRLLEDQLEEDDAYVLEVDDFGE